MIKRRFYKQEHVDGNDASDSSSSSSDSELEAEATEESDDAIAEVKEDNEACSSSSGYRSEDSSANEVDVDSSGLLINEDDAETGNDQPIFIDSQSSDKRGSEKQERHSNIMAEKDSLSAVIPACVLKCKSVFKCRICPRIVCLTEETLRAHLKSKRHSRSEKLLNEGRLKAILNSDGEIENQETAAELHARIVAIAQQDNPKRKNKGRHRQHKRLKKKKQGDISSMGKARKSSEGPAKKRRKSEN